MSLLSTFKTVGKVLAALEITEGVIEMTDSGEPRDDRPRTGEDAARTLVEEFEVEAGQVIRRVKELIRQGNVRTLRIMDSKGKYLIEVPLTVGVLAGGVIALSAPTLTALSAITGLVAKVKVEVVRNADPDDEPPAELEDGM